MSCDNPLGWTLWARTLGFSVLVINEIKSLTFIDWLDRTLLSLERDLKDLSISLLDNLWLERRYEELWLQWEFIYEISYGLPVLWI